jgi:peptidoglycan hydrolase-like protein with peptidoglycan-binding domain
MHRITGFVVAALLVAPLAASAQTADIQAQIVNLTAQLQQLQQLIAQLRSAQGAAAQNTPTLTACPTPLPTRNLSRGSTGLEVVGLQALLIGLGYLASGNTTGYYGPLTEAAVQRLQTAQGVVSSGTPSTTGYGVVGPRTRAAITQICYPTAVTQTVVPAPAPAPVAQYATITGFSASPSQITAGAQAVLNWNVQNAGGCVLSQQIPGQPTYVINTNAPLASAAVVAPASSTLYTLACTSIGAQGQGALRTIGVSVADPTP